MHDERIDELLPIYALGALDGDDLALVESHVAGGCPRCTGELAVWEHTATQLADSASIAAPPPDLRARLMAAVAEEERVTGVATLADRRRKTADVEPARRQGVWALAAAAVLILAAGVAIAYLVTALRTASEQLDSQVRQLAALEEQSDRQGRRLAERERQLEIVRDPYARVTQLAPDSAGPTAQVLWSPTHKRGLMYARGLAKVAPDKTYELWLIAGGTPIPAGTFNVDEAGNAVMELPEIPQGSAPDAFGVTVEPAGGSTTPTPPIMLQGKYPAG